MDLSQKYYFPLNLSTILGSPHLSFYQKIPTRLSKWGKILGNHYSVKITFADDHHRPNDRQGHGACV
jgi:hypothetical protein